jgi:ribosome-associated toxin RatA of RatAB toxin-antitoxin module
VAAGRKLGARRKRAMAEVHKSALVGYSASQIFRLVDAVEDYPQFLPWCSATELLYRDESVLRATIHINFRGIRQSFTTENPKREPQSMDINLIEGPFRMLQGKWRFTDLGGAGCKIELSMRYEFANALLEKLVGPVFGYIANSLVDAFVRRAQRIYG